MDHNIFLAINGLAGKWQWLDVIGKFFGGDYFLFLFALLVALALFDPKVRRNVYIAVGSTIIARLVITEIIKRVTDRPRPYEVLSVHQLLADSERGMSFPSGHATVYFALAFAFWGTRYFWPFFILAAVGSAARIFVGVHYPSDILVGAIVGAAASIVVLRLFKNKLLS